MKRNAILIVAGAIAFVALLAYLTMGGRKHRIEVCIAFQGQQACRVALGDTRQTAQRTATDNACALLASGVTETINCANTRPVSVRELE